MPVALAVIAVAAVGCGSSTSASPHPSRTTYTTATTTGSSTSSEPTTSADSLHPLTTGGSSTSNDPTQALTQLVAGLPAQHAATGPINTASGNLAAISFNDVNPPGGGTRPIVEILAFQGGGWTKTATVVLDLGGTIEAPSAGATPIVPVHVTGGTDPDFALKVSYNDGPHGAIISHTGGTWHALTFRGGATPSPTDEVLSPTFSDTEVTAVFNTCTPSCAQGSPVTVTYRYSPRTAQMVAVN